MLIASIVLILAACAAETNPTTTEEGVGLSSTTTSQSDDLLFPDVVGVTVTQNGDGTYRFDVTISSPYDSNEQYADAWRVLGPDGTEYGVRILTHPHANEQPFTRSLDGVEIPKDVTSVIVEGRDLINGWGGETVETPLN